MGINQSNIRTIIHYQLPQTLEEYATNGRAGRELQKSLYRLCSDDFQKWDAKSNGSCGAGDEEEANPTKISKEIANAFRWNNENALNEFDKMQTNA